MAAISEYGGVAGEVAVNTDMQTAMDMLLVAMRALEAAHDQVGWPQRLLRQEYPLMATQVRPAADQAEASLARLSKGVGTAHIELAALRDGLVHARDAYLEAEAANQWLFTPGALAVDALHDLVGTAVWVIRVGVTGAIFMLQGPLAALGSGVAPDGGPPTSGYLNSVTTQAVTGALCTGIALPVPGADFDYYSILLTIHAATVVTNALLGRTTGMAMVLHRSSKRPAATGVADLVARISEIQHHPGGAVMVEEVVGADGEAAYIVTVPGTQSFMPGADTMFGSEESSELMLHESSVLMDQVADAMVKAGVPPGAPVMLTGYSLGGIVTSALASSESFTDTFNVTHVLTVGAPAGHFTQRSDIDYLHVRNIGDVVPALGCDTTPDEVNVTTVVVDMRVHQDVLPQDAKTLVGAHALGNYGVMSALIDDHAGTSTQAWLESADAFMGTDKASMAMVFERAPVLDRPLPHEQATGPLLVWP